MKTSTYKNIIKKCTKSAAFKYLTTKQASHIKVNQIKYTQLETQKYLLSPIFSNEDVNQLYALRSGTTNCKVNFKNKYINGDLLCDLCGKENQDQQHLLKCEVLLRKLKSKQMLNNCPEYENIYSRDVIKQKEITLLYRDLFKIKSEMETEDSQRAPSTVGMVLVNDDNLPFSIVHQSPGK